jgi:hypothetical protein
MSASCGPRKELVESKKFHRNMVENWNEPISRGSAEQFEGFLICVFMLIREWRLN